MENNLRISNLNDFIFCPRSIYFHNLYDEIEEENFHSTYQVRGKLKHKNIDGKNYSTKKAVIQSLNVFSEELNLVGKIDLYDREKKELIERKNKITKIYYGYLLQIWAQYFCLKEMGFEIKKLAFYSLADNKKITVRLPSRKNKLELKKLVGAIKSFEMNDKTFKQNLNKCQKCIYRNVCDFYQDVE